MNTSSHGPSDQRPISSSAEVPPRVAARYGSENAIPWPTPPIPGCHLATFLGEGNQTTEPLTISGDASLRIATEGAPFQAQVHHADGQPEGPPLDVVQAGLALGGIQVPGTFYLTIRAPKRWGITVAWK